MAVDHNNPQSRDEEILIATIDGKEYDKLPQSRIEELLLELKEVIEEGGGGEGGLIQKIFLNGVEQEVVNKAVYLTVITNTVNDLVNYYLKTDTYSKLEVNNLIAAISTLHLQKVETLPTEDISQTTIYLVPKTTLLTNNVYDEYINTDGTSAGWELIGDTQIDLSDYVTFTDLEDILDDYALAVDLTTVANAVTSIKDGTTIDSFGDVETALSDKQGATDNSLETEAKTIVGAINEHEGDIDSLKSNLTNLDNEVNGDAITYPYADVITIEDAVPSNLADCSVKIEPVQSGSGDPSPTNVRPITGHTEASVEVTDGDETTKTYTIALGDTIYGGEVDFDSGVLSSYGDIINENNFTSCSSSPSTGGLYYVNCNVSAVSNVGMSNMLPKEDHAWDKTYPCVNIYESRIRIYGNFTSLAEFKEQYSGLQVYYQKATPTTIQLTPQQIQLLKGTNTLTASTGDISVTVNGVSGAIGAVQEQVNATDAALAELAEKLPTAPTTDGAYVLTVTVADGTPTYSWESAT